MLVLVMGVGRARLRWVVAVVASMSLLAGCGSSVVAVQGDGASSTTTTTTTVSARRSNDRQTPAPAASATAAVLAGGHWSALPSAPIPPRRDASVVWTGKELLVWGGASGPHGARLHADGAAYNPATRTWRRLPPAPISGREGQAAAWTGTQMVIWGGYDHVSVDSSAVSNTGAAYNPTTNRWTTLPAAPLSARAYPLAAWTGSQVLILGGRPAVQTVTLHSFTDGALYDPATGTWTHLDPPAAPKGHNLDWVAGAQVGQFYLAWSDWATGRSLGHDTFLESGGNDLYSYDEATRNWQLEPNTPDAIPNVEDATAPAGR